MPSKKNKKPEMPVRSGRLVFSLVARPAVDLNNLRPSSHAGATVAALRKFGKATSDQIIAEVARRKKIETRMDVYRAVHWQLNDLRKRKVLKVVSRHGGNSRAA